MLSKPLVGLGIKTAAAAGFAGAWISLIAIATSFFFCVFYAKNARLNETSYSALAFARLIARDNGTLLTAYAEEFDADYAFTFEYSDLKIRNLTVSGRLYVSETELLSGLSELGRSPVSVVELTPFDKKSYTAIYAKILGTEESYGGLIFLKGFLLSETAEKFFPRMLWTLLLAPLFAVAGFFAGSRVAKEVAEADKGLKQEYRLYYGSDYEEVTPVRRDVNLIQSKLLSAHNEYHKMEARKERAERELFKLEKELDREFFNKALLLDSESMDLRLERRRLTNLIEHSENLLIRDSSAAHGEVVSIPFLKYFEGRLTAALVLLLRGEYEEFFIQIPKMGEDIFSMSTFLAAPSVIKRVKFPKLAEDASIFIEKLFKIRAAFYFSETAKQFECSFEFIKVLVSAMATFTRLAGGIRVSAETYSEEGEKHLLVILSAEKGGGDIPTPKEQNCMREIVAAVFGGEHTIFEENGSVFAEFRVK